MFPKARSMGQAAFREEGCREGTPLVGKRHNLRGLGFREAFGGGELLIAIDCWLIIKDE